MSELKVDLPLADPVGLTREKLLEELQSAQQQAAQHSNLAVQYQGAVLIIQHLLAELDTPKPSGVAPKRKYTRKGSTGNGGVGTAPQGETKPSWQRTHIYGSPAP